MRQIQRGTMRNLIQRWNRAVVTTAGAMALSSAVWSQEMESAEPAPVAVIPMNVDIDDAQKEAMISPEARAAREGGVAGGRPTCSGDPDNLFYPLNQGTWTLVPFFGDGATGAGPAQGPAGTEDGEANDDDSAFFNFSFLFVLYGDTYGSCYINNNGNISFGQRFSTFTSQPFPIDGFPMVAPFWADVDTRTNNGAVWYRQLDSNNDGLNDTLVVTWENVGYYFQEGELRNTFQVAISNGTNPQMGLGYNVLFSYDNMCWTTGDASGGTNGFGGTASTVGANRGDGTYAAVFGRFNQNNGNYDGPGGANDGVNWLDGRTLRFNTDTINNIPPVATGFPANNTRTVSAGDLMFEQVQFLSPEPGQTTQLFITDLDGAAAHGCVINTSSGNVATGSFLWNTTCDDVGSYRFSLRAVDNFNPPGVTILQLTINVTQPTGLPTVELTDPQPFECSCNPISFSGSAYDLPDSEGRFDSYELQYATNPNGPWTTFDTGTTHVTNGVLGSWDTTNISQGYYFVRLIARKECGPDASVVSLVFVDKQFDTIDLRSPQSGNILGGIVCFDGTVTDGNSGGCFDNYTIRYATPPNYNNYQPVDPANPEYNTPIQNDPLGSWNTASGPTAVPDGTYRVQVTGTDNCGHSRNVRRDIIIDNTAPVAVITSLVNCDSVSGIVEIRGTATDAHLAGWTLQYAGGDSNTWVTIASGNTNVVNGVLANWNTNGLPKCAYALRLIASDLAGVNCSGYTHQTEFVVTVENGIRGDMNCDGLVNNFDINPFVLCLSSGECGCQ